MKVPKRNKFLLISFILLVIFSITIPLTQVAMRVYFKKQIFLYYYQESSSNYCQVVRTLDISELTGNAIEISSQQLKATLNEALLIPNETELSNNNSKNIFVNNAQVDGDIATISLSHNFYSLTETERIRTTTALTLAIKANFPEINRLLWFVAEQKALDVNDSEDAVLPRIIANYLQLEGEDTSMKAVAMKLQKNILNTRMAIMPRERMVLPVGKMPSGKPISIKDCRLQ